MPVLILMALVKENHILSLVNEMRSSKSGSNARQVAENDLTGKGCEIGLENDEKAWHAKKMWSRGNNYDTLPTSNYQSKATSHHTPWTDLNTSLPTVSWYLLQ